MDKVYNIITLTIITNPSIDKYDDDILESIDSISFVKNIKINEIYFPLNGMKIDTVELFVNTKH